MNLNKDYILRQVAGMWALFPTGEAARTFNGFLKLNEAGAFLWRRLEEGNTPSELAAALVETYGIPLEQAKADVDAFLGNLRNNGCLEM